MSVEREDIEILEKHFDDRYVLQSDCNDKQEAVNKKFANDDKRIELVTRDIGFFKKLGWILVTASVGQLVLMFFELMKG